MSTLSLPALRAQMAQREGGDWRVYVCTDLWPSHSFGRALPVPTVTERADVLAAFGFEPVPGAEWEWSEDARDFGDPSSPVVLIAVLAVRPIEGAE